MTKAISIGLACLFVASSAFAQNAPYFPEPLRLAEAHAAAGRVRRRQAGRRDQVRAWPTTTIRRRTTRPSSISKVSRPTEPFDSILGPHSVRAPLNGLIIRHGYIVAEWGDTEARRHHQQRHQDVPDDRRRPGVAEGADSRRQRLRARLHAAARRSVRRAAQPEDQVGSPAAADERLAGHAVGQAGLGGSSGRRDAERLAEPQAVRAGHALQVQRRARERDGAGGAAGVAPAAARGAARGSDGADRRLVARGAGTATRTRGSTSTARRCSR